MLQKKTTKICAKYRIPELKKYKKGWRVVFWYQKNGVLVRHILRVEKYKKAFERCKDAEIWITENLCVPLLAELEKGWTPEQGEPNFCKNDNITLSALTDLFLQDAGERYAAHLINSTSYNSYKCFCKVITTALNAESGGIEDCTIKELTKAKAEKFCIQIKAQREWQTKTANNFIKLCRMLLKFAVDNGFAAFNPFEKVPLFKGDEKSKRTITKDEQQKIYSHLRDTNLPFLVFTQLVYTDLIRPVEIFRLKCKDLSVEKLEITLSAKNSKNKKARILPIPQSLAPLFRHYLKVIDFENQSPDAYLFYKDFLPATAQNPLGSAYASCRWRTMCDTLDINSDCKLYGLKHTGISDMLDVLPVNTVRLLAGHSDTKQTMQYANHEDAQKREAIINKAPIYGAAQMPKLFSD